MPSDPVDVEKLAEEIAHRLTEGVYDVPSLETREEFLVALKAEILAAIREQGERIRALEAERDALDKDYGNLVAEYNAMGARLREAEAREGRQAMAIEMAADDLTGWFYLSDGVPWFAINCNDAFGYATADAETVPWDNIPEVYRRWKADPKMGALSWAVERRGIEPLPEVRAALRPPDARPAETCVRGQGMCDVDVCETHKTIWPCSARPAEPMKLTGSTRETPLVASSEGESAIAERTPTSAEGCTGSRSARGRNCEELTSPAHGVSLVPPTQECPACEIGSAVLQLPTGHLTCWNCLHVFEPPADPPKTTHLRCPACKVMWRRSGETDVPGNYMRCPMCFESYSLHQMRPELCEPPSSEGPCPCGRPDRNHTHLREGR